MRRMTFQATVSFNLESPTDPLDAVFFPSAVVCNMNALRASFLAEVGEDPGKTQHNTTTHLTKNHAINGFSSSTY